MIQQLRKDVEIYDANVFMHAAAKVLTPEAREVFYNHLQNARDSGDPCRIVESTWVNMLMIFVQAIDKRAKEEHPELFAKKDPITGETGEEQLARIAEEKQEIAAIKQIIAKEGKVDGPDGIQQQGS